MQERQAVDEAGADTLVDEIVADHDAIFRALRADWSREVFAADLSLPQMRVLLLLDRYGDRSMSQLAEALGRSLPTVGGLTDRLVEAGLVQRAEHSEDRRVTIARLTPAGQELVDNLSAANLDNTRRLIERLNADELRLVKAALAVLRREALALAQEADAASSREPAAAS